MPTLIEIPDDVPVVALAAALSRLGLRIQARPGQYGALVATRQIVAHPGQAALPLDDGLTLFCHPARDHAHGLAVAGVRR